MSYCHVIRGCTDTLRASVRAHIYTMGYSNSEVHLWTVGCSSRWRALIHQGRQQKLGCIDTLGDTVTDGVLARGYS